MTLRIIAVDVHFHLRSVQMRFKAAWSAVLVAAAVSTMSPANACFTIIVGKNVSADGNIIEQTPFLRHLKHRNWCFSLLKF